MKKFYNLGAWSICQRLSVWTFKTFYSGYQKTCILAHSEDPDKMSYNVAFHLIQHCLLILLFHTGPESHELPRIDKYLDSCLNRTQFVKILTDSHSP